MNEKSHGGRLAFGDFVLDPEVGELSRDGEAVALRPKATAVLVELVTRAGSLVPHEDLLEAGWGDDHVDEDAALHNAVREIRQALDESASDPRFVATVHRRGYRFIADVREIGAPAGPAQIVAPPSSGSGWPRVAAAAVVLAVAGLGAFYGLRGEEPADPVPVVDTPENVLRARHMVERGDAAQIREAAAVLREAVKGSSDPLAWSGLAVAETRLGRLEEARAAALRALELRRDDADAHRVLGQLALVNGTFDKAEGYLLRALELDPHSGRSQHAWAYYLAAFGRMDEAVGMARQARRLAPDRDVARANLARYLYYARHYEGAMEETALATDSGALDGVVQSLLHTRYATAWMLEDYEASREALVDYVATLEARPESLDDARRMAPREGATMLLRWLADHWLQRAELHDPSYRVSAVLVLAQLGDRAAVVEQMRLIAEQAGGPTLRRWLYDPRLAPYLEEARLSGLETVGEIVAVAEPVR